ncbi:MAG TPA: DUF4124 domain-containing protein [Burkholderiales bacterium]|jgi:hypothetical protein|nr:DUF4124 domain-containing protein [Burkholderiales bacterium]
MMRSLVFAAGLLVAGSACAQYKWTDQNGRVQYSDTPPAGVNAAPMRQRSAPPPRAESSDSKDDAKDAKDDAKDAKKGPLTPAEQDAAFRKRQQEAAKEREKQAKAEQDNQAKKDNCRRSQEAVRSLETGRAMRTDAQGENYYLDEAQIAQEKSRAQQLMQEWCN